MEYKAEIYLTDRSKETILRYLEQAMKSASSVEDEEVLGDMYKQLEKIKG